jgi:tetratricopeptide (TPR) repeat protein
VIDEEEWLAELGLASPERSVRRLCTSTEISRLLGVPLARVRAWSRAGLIRPVRAVHRLEYFEFRQVAAAKSLADLVEGGVSPERIRRSLERLRGWLPDAAESLAARALLGEPGELLLRLDGGELADPTGQLRLDFAGERAIDEPLLLRTPRQWCAEAERREDAGELAEAARAYHEALAADPTLPEAHFGLANVLYLLEDAAEAAAEYLRAVELDPEYVEAWNNLGNAFDELGETDAALHAYRRAVAVAPDYGEAHFNLAETLWSDGEPDEARAHYAIYLEREPTSPWGKHIRERLSGPSI